MEDVVILVVGDSRIKRTVILVTPDDLLKELRTLGVDISRKTLLNYETAKLVSAAQRGSGGRGVGRYSDFPLSAVQEAYAAYNMINVEKYGVFETRDKQILSAHFEKDPVAFNDIATMQIFNVPNDKDLDNFILREVKWAVEKATINAVCLYISYLTVAEWKFNSSANFGIYYIKENGVWVKKVYLWEGDWEKSGWDEPQEGVTVIAVDADRGNQDTLIYSVVRGGGRRVISDWDLLTKGPLPF